MASAAKNQAIPTASTLIYDSPTEGSGVTTFKVQCLSTGSDVLVQLPGLHEATDWFPIPAGESEYFRLNNMGIRKVYAKGDGGTANINYGAVAKTLGV